MYYFFNLIYYPRRWRNGSLLDTCFALNGLEEAFFTAVCALGDCTVLSPFLVAFFFALLFFMARTIIIKNSTSTIITKIKDTTINLSPFVNHFLPLYCKLFANIKQANFCKIIVNNVF